MRSHCDGGQGCARRRYRSTAPLLTLPPRQFRGATDERVPVWLGPKAAPSLQHAAPARKLDFASRDHPPRRHASDPQMTDPPLVRAQHLDMTFSPESIALRDVSFSLEDSEFVSLIGPSG